MLLNLTHYTTLRLSCAYCKLCCLLYALITAEIPIKFSPAVFHSKVVIFVVNCRTLEVLERGESSWPTRVRVYTTCIIIIIIIIIIITLADYSAKTYQVVKSLVLFRSSSTRWNLQQTVQKAILLNSTSMHLKLSFKIGELRHDRPPEIQYRTHTHREISHTCRRTTPHGTTLRSVTFRLVCNARYLLTNLWTDS